jgi:hypothetical protein
MSCRAALHSGGGRSARGARDLSSLLEKLLKAVAKPHVRRLVDHLRQCVENLSFGAIEILNLVDV